MCAKPSWLRLKPNAFPSTSSPFPLERRVHYSSRKRRAQRPHYGSPYELFERNTGTAIGRRRSKRKPRRDSRIVSSPLFALHRCGAPDIASAGRVLGCCSVGLSFCVPKFPIISRRRQFQNLDYPNCPEPVPDPSSRAPSALDYAEYGSSQPRRRSPTLAVDSRTPENLALRAEIESAVTDAVSKLPKPLSDVFTRCGVSGLSIRDTAEALGLTVPATKTRLFRARSQLRQELRKAFGSGLTLATLRIGLRS
jgi:hypothetical protein